jgi:hypothetical protein
MNNSISLQQAIDMTKLFREQKDNIVNPDMIGKNVILTCETFDRAIFDSILSQTGCVGMRIYSGLNPNLSLRSIIVGVDDQNKDMLPDNAFAIGGDGRSIGEDGQPCPPYCPPSSPLNP